MGVGYYVMCRECGDGTKPIGPFASEQARAAWQVQHSRQTGHSRWLVRDQPDDPGDFD